MVADALRPLREAGEAFQEAARAALEALNRQDPPDHQPPPLIAVYRHPCPKRRGVSTALQLKEVYWVSSEPLVSAVPETSDGELRSVSTVAAWPGGDPRFAFVFREGRCRACGQTARSPRGRLVLTKDRPPTAGRVAR